MAEINLIVEGMHCGACVKRVTQAISNAISGAGATRVEEVRVGAARFVADDAQAATEQAIAALAKAGYPAHPDPSRTDSAHSAA